ncbi:MAG: hypothetical protein AB7F82_05580 [Alphaproteobacteria bacterium]
MGKKTDRVVFRTDADIQTVVGAFLNLHPMQESHFSVREGGGRLYVNRFCKASGRFISAAARDDDVRNADIVCLGGYDHEGERIGAMTRAALSLTRLGPDSPTDSRPAMMDARQKRSYSVLVHQPVYDGRTRVEEVYNWNINKKHISSEMEYFAAQLWQHRFLDNQGRLKPVTQFRGFSLLTYSMGARNGWMLANALERRLTDAGKSQEQVQEYFSKMRQVNIGASVDWERRPVNTPSIPNITILHPDDTGMAYRDSFSVTVDRMAKQFSGSTPPFVEEDLVNWPRHKLVLLNPYYVPKEVDGKQNMNMHGLFEYLTGISMAMNKTDELGKIKSYLTMSGHYQGARGEGADRQMGG